MLNVNIDLNGVCYFIIMKGNKIRAIIKRRKRFRIKYGMTKDSYNH